MASLTQTVARRVTATMAGNGTREISDAARWEAVEEATEPPPRGALSRGRWSSLRNVLEVADPKNAYAYHYLGVAFFEVGEPRTGPRRLPREPQARAPGYLGAPCSPSVTSFASSETSRAPLREGLAALSRIGVGDPDALYAVGLAYHAAGDTTAARKYLEAFLATSPEFEVAVEVRALLGTM